MRASGRPCRRKESRLSPYPVEGLRARSNRGVGLVDAPGKRERHSERHFSHRPREDRRRRQHVDPAAVAFRVIDVGQEIAFHVEDSPELGCAVQPFQGKRRLSDHGERLGQETIELPVGQRRPVVPGHIAKRVEACPRLGVKNEPHAPRMGIEKDEGAFHSGDSGPGPFGCCRIINM
jgi:hypothetical protein